jgi:3-hydroxybutyryl-CoA dehydratase
VTAFGRALTTRSGYGPVPLTFPMRWLCLPALREPISRELRLERALLVHQSQTFAYARPLDLERDFTIEVDARRTPPAGGRVTMRATVRDDRGDAIFVAETLVRAVEGAAIAPVPRRAAPVPSSDIPGLEVAPIDAAQTRRYAAAALDDNPLHYDPEAARAAGLDGPIVQGMLLAGQFEPALSAWRPDLRIERLYAGFLRPLPVGGAVVVNGRIAQSTPAAGGDRLVVRLTVRDGAGDMVCIGEVEGWAPERTG